MCIAFGSPTTKIVKGNDKNGSSSPEQFLGKLHTGNLSRRILQNLESRPLRRVVKQFLRFRFGPRTIEPREIATEVSHFLEVSCWTRFNREIEIRILVLLELWKLQQKVSSI